jgi:uncharacterized protein YqgC (DUF456 family)
VDTLALNLLVGAVILVGLIGVVLPVLPGVLLIWGAVLVWVIKFLIPGRQMQAAGIPGRTLLLGAGLGVVGFFVVPVVGALVGFVLGVYLAERSRLGAHDPAWEATRTALRGALLSIVIEFAAGVVCAGIWLVGAIATA